MGNADIYNDGGGAGRVLSRIIAGEIERLIAARGVAVVLFDSAPELAESYRELSRVDLPWTRVVGFQLAEWCGVGADDPRAGRRVLLDALVCRVAMAEFHSLRGEAANLGAVCVNYAELLAARSAVVAPLSPLAIVTVGVDGQIGSPPLPVKTSPFGREGDLSESKVSALEVVSGGESLGLTREALREYDRLILHRGGVTSGVTWMQRGEDGEGRGQYEPYHDTSHR